MLFVYLHTFQHLQFQTTDRFLLSEFIFGKTTYIGILLFHAGTKHAETIEFLEFTHALAKNVLKRSEGDFRHHWNKYLPLLFLNHKTSSYASLGSEPSRFFNERIP